VAPGGSWGYVGAGVSAWILAAVRGVVELLPGGLGVSPPPRPPSPRLRSSVKVGGLLPGLAWRT
jgi:hypothetical protein